MDRQNEFLHFAAHIYALTLALLIQVALGVVRQLFLLRSLGGVLLGTTLGYRLSILYCYEHSVLMISR